MFGVRKAEHRMEAEEASNKHFTRNTHKTTEGLFNKSVVTDHVSQSNHIMNWGQAKVIGREQDWFRRGMKEAIQIRIRGRETLNRDQGRHNLPDVYNPILDRSTGKRQQSI